jgi:phosphoesterase RecJ-like protein
MIPSDPNAMRAVAEAVRKGSCFVVASHARPDGDAIGSMLAMGMLLEQLGKHADMISCDRVPLLYQNLPWANRVRIAQHVESPCSTAILLECDGTERTGLKGLDSMPLINLDHHLSGRRFGAINWIECSASAVAELVYMLAIELGATITPEMATCLYTALLTDTGSFCYGTTGAGTFDLAHQLVAMGANPTSIAQDVYFSNPLSKLLLLGAALGNLHREGNVAWLSITQQDMERTHAAEEDCEGIVNYAVSIAGVDLAVFLRELPDHRVRLSLRSKGAVNVAAVAEEFGGGGHENASGCTLDGPMHEAIDRILPVLHRTVGGLKDAHSAG